MLYKSTVKVRLLVTLLRQSIMICVVNVEKVTNAHAIVVVVNFYFFFYILKRNYIVVMKK